MHSTTTQTILFLCKAKVGCYATSGNPSTLLAGMLVNYNQILYRCKINNITDVGIHTRNYRQERVYNIIIL